MALAARCPHCRSLFRVVADQLKLRGGLVRCGVCRQVFDAIGSLNYVDEDAVAQRDDDLRIPRPRVGAAAAKAPPTLYVSAVDREALGTPAPEPATPPEGPRPTDAAPRPAPEARLPQAAAPAARGSAVKAPPGASVPAIRAADATPADLDVPTLGGHATDLAGPATDLGTASSDVRGRKTDRSGPPADAGGRKTDIGGFVTDKVARTTDIGGAVADRNGRKSDLGGPKTDLGGPQTDIDGGRRTDIGGPVTDIGGRRTDIGKLDLTRPQPSSNTVPAAARAADRSSARAPRRAAPAEASAPAEGGVAPAWPPHAETELSGADADPVTRAVDPLPADQAPLFLRQRQARRRRGISIVFGGGSLLLGLALALQLGIAMRTDLLMRWPQLRPMLQQACDVYACTVGWPMHAELLAVVGSELQAIPGTEAMELAAVIRNRADFTMALPSVEVTLTDTQNRAVARKVFTPLDYLEAGSGASARIDEGIGAGADYSIKLDFEARGLNAAGFVVYPFYP